KFSTFVVRSLRVAPLARLRRRMGKRRSSLGEINCAKNAIHEFAAGRKRVAYKVDNDTFCRQASRSLDRTRANADEFQAEAVDDRSPQSRRCHCAADRRREIRAHQR